MRRLVPAFIVGPVLLLVGTCAMALGLGRVSTLSNLGSPLEFSIALSAQPGDAVSSECVLADVYAGDSRVPPEMVRVRVNRGSDGAPSSLRVITGTRIDEPVASVELTLDCGTRLTRKYVVFIDPPLLNLAQADGEAPALSGAAAAVPRAAPSAREPRSAASARRARSGGPRQPSSVQAGGTGSASASRQRRLANAEAARAARAAAARDVDKGSRLKLESAPAMVAGAPVKERPAAAGIAAAGGALAAATASAASGRPAVVAPSVAPAGGSGASAAASGASAASAAAMGGLLGELAGKADADALALNAERLRSLEERMNRLRSDNQAMQTSMAELQNRLREAEANRYANPLVYGLIAALVLLVLAVIALLWRQAGMRKESDWMRAAAAESGFDEAGASAPRTPVRPSAVPAVRSAAAAAAAAGLSGSETAPSMGPRVAPAVSAAALGGAGAVLVADLAKPAAPKPPVSPPAPHEATSVHQPGREVTVEELIDLEQQADFFVVLGQDDAAIDLLMGHVQGTGGASPLPYLKLLEIHRRRDEREAYDRVRERFNRRFSAFAPEWEAHSGHHRALEAYPAVVERLQTLWPKPTQAMDALAGLLFQRDLTAPTFDLPAYAELLFLYSLARELSEHEPPADGVDLLLPLDDGPPSPPGGKGGAALGALGVGAAGATLAGMSLAPKADAAPGLPELPPTYPVPLGFTPSDLPGSGTDDHGFLDLNISDDPEEPKGPLSKY